MPPCAIKKKQKTEEKQIITKNFVDENLCISLLNTFFNNNTHLLFKFDRGNDSEVNFKKDSRIVQHIINQNISIYVIVPNKDTATNSIKICFRRDSLSLYSRFYLIFNATAFLFCAVKMSGYFYNLFIVYKLGLQTTALFSMVNDKVPFMEAAKQITLLNGSLLIGGLLTIL